MDPLFKVWKHEMIMFYKPNDEWESLHHYYQRQLVRKESLIKD